MNKMNSPAGNLKRCPQRFSILLIGCTGHGKSATINHLLNTDTIKTKSSKPESRETVEYLVAVNNHDNEGDSDQKLSFIDTPGLNDPRGIKQDACNLHSVKKFFETHPLYSEFKCYPNLIFLVISANEHRIDESNSKLAHTLCALQQLDVVDIHHPNVVAVLTFCYSESHNVLKWEKNMAKKKDTISRNIFKALGVQAPVVLLENDMDSYSRETSGDFTVLPNDERQLKNLYEACQIILKENGDHNGVSTFNIGLARKNHRLVADFKVLANDSRKNPISEVEKNLLNILRESTEDGDDNEENSCHLVKENDSANNPISKDPQDLSNTLRGSTEDELMREIQPWKVLNGNHRRPDIMTTVAILFILFCMIAWLAAAFFSGLKE